MCLTLSTSTANWMVLSALRSVCTTTLATLRWTKISPGGRSTIWVAGTRESEQPIHRYLGACCCASFSKKSGSWAVMLAAQRRLLASRSFSEFIDGPVACSKTYADVFRFGEEVQRVAASFAAQARLAHAAEWRAQVAQQPAI